MDEILKMRLMGGVSYLPLFNKPNEGEGGGDAGEGDNSGEGEGDAGGAGNGGGNGGGSGRFKSGLQQGGEGSGDGEGEGDGGDPANKNGEGNNGGRPDNVPEKFWDSKKGELNSDAMLKSYADLESQIGKLKRDKGIGGEVPKSADEYFADGLAFGDDVDRFQPVDADDPGLKAWAEVCHKHGIGIEGAKTMALEMFGLMNEHMPAPIDPEQERKALGKNANGIIEGVTTWVNGLDQAGELNDADADIIAGLMTNAKGMAFLAKMRGMSGEKPIPLDLGDGATGVMSAKEWQGKLKAAYTKGDQSEIERLEKMGEAIFGNEPAHGSPLRGL